MGYTIDQLKSIMIRPSIVLLNALYNLSLPLDTYSIRMLGFDATLGVRRYYIDVNIIDGLLLRIYLHKELDVISTSPYPEVYNINNQSAMYIHHTTIRGINLDIDMTRLINELVALGGVYQVTSSGALVTFDASLAENYLVDASANYFTDHSGNRIILNL